MNSWRQNWQAGLLPGLSITGFVILARLLGLLQPVEWRVFDTALRSRPPEQTDPRITVVNITEEDVQKELGYPIEDKNLATLINKLQAYSPRVIGIDIFRDQPVGEGYAALEAELTSAENVIGIESMDTPTISPPPMLPEAQIGFADAVVDDDGRLRRSQLANADEAGNYRFSLTLQLAQTYLAADGIILDNGIKDPETMRFGEVEIPRFYPHTGGYVRTDNGGNQALINFRAGNVPFEQVSYLDIVEGDVASELLQNRALLIGYAAESVKDYESSGAIANANPSAIPGITIQAHALSQILSAVYDGRAFIRALPHLVEYFLILASGALGIAFAHWQRKPGVHLAIVIGTSVSWILLAYLIIIAAWWLPVVPTLTVFLLNAITLYPFYQAQSLLQAQLKEQEKLIEQTYTTIHNGPLQVIAQMLKAWPVGAVAVAESRSQLESVNKELRGIREILQAEVRSPSEKLVMMGEQSIDLQMPLHIVLSEIYSNTIERYREFFQPLIKIRSFAPMADGQLTGREKRAIGRFLEEALTNIYKYAGETTRITISCERTETHNIVKVIDDGKGSTNLQHIGHEGYGTKQANRIARQLGGRFERKAVESKGTYCELRWPIQSSVWRWWSR